MKILLIDDDVQFCQTFADNAQIEHNINIIYFHNHQDGFAELRKDEAYQALILDARCFKTPDDEQIGGDGNDSALSFALELLANFEKETERYLPWVVYTAYEHEFSRFFGNPTTKIFRKGKGASHELFTYLKQEIANLPNTQLEKQYALVFEVFTNGYLTQNTKTDLLNILKNNNSVDISEIRKSIALIRTIKETITDDVVREGLAKRSIVKLPELIDYYSKSIHKLASNYGSHAAKKDIQPTKYTVISLTNALLEILLWFNRYKKNNS